MDFPHNLWDLSATTLPPQITSLDESDFLSILSKQLNPAAVLPAQSSLSAQALAQQITQQQGVSPPVSEESSPSPPTNTSGLAKSSSTTAAAVASNTDGNDHKRKKILRDESEESDSDDDQPPTKAQKEQPAKKGKRKSTGDEVRANKRKEQNRAAQRAFRERKEKHVRDLEDQVSALEQKSTAQATENENLRELLGRLQNENLMLKQSAFTFNFNSAQTQTPRSTATPSVSNTRTTPSTVTSPVDKSPSTGPTQKEPTPATQQQTNNNSANGTGYTPLLSFSSINNNNNSTDGLISMTNTPPINPLAASSPLTFFSPPPTHAVPSPYTTLASNPMYTSYTDFSAWDQFFQNAALDQTLAGVGSDPSLMQQVNFSGASGMEDLLTSTDNFSELIPFSSFSPSSSGMGNSPIDHAATAAKANTPATSNANTASSNNNNNYAFSLASREQATTNRPSLLPARSSSPCGGADPDEAPLPGSSHHNPSMSSMSVGKPASGVSVKDVMEHDGTKCPKTKEDLARLIEGQPLATLGTVPGMQPQPGVTPPTTFSEKKTAKLKEVWDRLKNHPRFEEVDMDDLCKELSSKVKCDGGMPGLDESDKPCEELSKIIDAVRAKKAEEAKAAQQVKQQQRVIQSISTGGLPESTMSTTPPTASSSSASASPNLMSNFNLFGTSPYNSYLPFAMPPQSATSTSFGGGDMGFDSRRPSQVGQHRSSSDGSSFVTTPASAQGLGINGSTINGSSPMVVDQSMGGDSWLAGAFEMPASPGSQFLSFLNGTSTNAAGGAGAFSPNLFLNLPEKE